jgi:hypothetical protein
MKACVKAKGSEQSTVVRSVGKTSIFIGFGVRRIETVRNNVQTIVKIGSSLTIINPRLVSRFFLCELSCRYSSMYGNGTTDESHSLISRFLLRIRKQQNATVACWVDIDQKVPAIN